MAQQTAVEWLQQSMEIHLSHEQKMQFEGLYQQANKMFEKQIKEAAKELYPIKNTGSMFMPNRDELNTSRSIYTEAENYYNENYDILRK